ncbi:hypothetical protein Scuro_18 [Acinetobacter phage Scuro]|nr:hypothetical protein Scuro_18 [Acinetobacter phage Scuro]
MKPTIEQIRAFYAQYDGSPIMVQGAPIEEVKAALDRFSKDLEKMSAAQQKIVDTIESEGFKELEERMRKSARQRGKSFENIEARMLITTASERSEFFKYGRSPVQAWLDEAGFPWPKPNVLQIDEDYAEYCTDLDNRPNFLAWCISQMHHPVTTNLGATKCVLSQL